jgi:hypothetical protein
MDAGDFAVFYSGSKDNYIFGTEFLVNKKYKHKLLGSEPMCFRREREYQ